MNGNNEMPLQIVTSMEANDNDVEERRRRNRESAARSRARIKLQLDKAMERLSAQKARKKALMNEMALVKEQLKRIKAEQLFHNRYCIQPNPYCNGFVGVRRTHTVVHRDETINSNNWMSDKDIETDNQSDNSSTVSML